MSAHASVKRITRYTAVGAICAATYNVVMILGSLAGGDYVTLSFLSFFITTPLGYWLHARFTFRMRLSWRNFFRFASSIAAGFPVYFLSMAALCSGLHVAIAYAAPITTILLYVWNYGWAHWAILGRSRWP